MNKGLIFMAVSLLVAVAGYFLSPVVMYAGIGVFLILLAIFLSTKGKNKKTVSKVGVTQAALESYRPKALELIDILGGNKNILGMGSCLSRVRVTVEDMDSIDPQRLKGLGATGMVASGNQIQVIFGNESEPLRLAVEEALQQAGLKESGKI